MNYSLISFREPLRDTHIINLQRRRDLSFWRVDKIHIYNTLHWTYMEIRGCFPLDMIVMFQALVGLLEGISHLLKNMVAHSIPGSSIFSTVFQYFLHEFVWRLIYSQTHPFIASFEQCSKPSVIRLFWLTEKESRNENPWKISANIFCRINTNWLGPLLIQGALKKSCWLTSMIVSTIIVL